MSNWLPAIAVFRVLALSLALGALEAQSAYPTFEVASVRPHLLPPGAVKPSVWSPTFQCDPTWHCGVTGNRFREVTVSLADLIIDAYNVKRTQIFGLPNWGDSSRDLYDVDATIAGETLASADEARLMLRSLLADRFQLRIHQETRELPVYVLAEAKTGIKLVPNQTACGKGGGARARAASQTDLPAEATVRAPEDLLPFSFYAEQLSVRLGRAVIDHTGLEGAGYCTVEGQSPMLAIMLGTTSGSSIFTAVEEKWGVKIEARRASVNVVVVDHVEKPSEN